MTHRLFSRNAASSRAIPIEKVIEQVSTSPAVPCHWGKNQSGMQAKEEVTNKINSMGHWIDAASSAAYHAGKLKHHGLHKQVVNRILEPFQMMKTVVTSTDFDNFFWLRKHPDAQPEIKLLAEKMWEALQGSESNTLDPKDWHVPYYKKGFWMQGMKDALEDALAISSSCCAQVSYRLLDDSLEKARTIYARLVESEPVHASPFEHQASPMDEAGEFWDEGGDYSLNTHDPLTWQEGVTHSDKFGNLWSGNFKGWIQHRQLIKNNACWDYKE